MYWRRASIQDGQASTSASDVTILKLFSAITSLFFVVIEKNSIFGISEFYYLSYANFHLFRDGHVTTFRHLSGAYVC